MTKPFIKQLAHVCIFSRDLEKSEAFYRDGFGFETAFISSARPTRSGFTSTLVAVPLWKCSARTARATTRPTRSTISVLRRTIWMG
ncbi:VOC family protein [Devosia sp. 2618]|uniref:VOC family protein n=1 Tax=Devosia sp. 2618 TaxID=3156454 RepID=UPI003391269D